MAIRLSRANHDVPFVSMGNFGHGANVACSFESPCPSSHTCFVSKLAEVATSSLILLYVHKFIPLLFGASFVLALSRSNALCHKSTFFREVQTGCHDLVQNEPWEINDRALHPQTRVVAVVVDFCETIRLLLDFAKSLSCR